MVTSLRSRLRAAARGQRERGSAGVELVVIFPVVLLLLLGGVQATVWYHARSVALSAAQEGARAASVQEATAGDGQAAADSFLARAGGTGTLPGAGVEARRDATAAVVTVTGRSHSLVPLLSGIPISQSASMPVERVTG